MQDTHATANASNMPLSDDALDTVQGGISGASIGGLTGGALGVGGFAVLAIGSGVAVMGAPVLIAGAAVGAAGAAVGAGVGAVVSWIKNR